MLSAEAFDCLHTHVSAVEESDSGPWTGAHTSVTLTTRSRLKMPVVRAFFRSGGDVDVVVTFRVERGLFRRRILAWLEIDGREAARGISKVLELKHTFDRTVLAKLITDMERQAEQLKLIGSPARSIATTSAGSHR